MRIIEKYTFVLIFLGHIVLLSLFCIGFEHTKTVVDLGLSQSMIAYAYQETVSHQVQHQEKSKSIATKKDVIKIHSALQSINQQSLTQVAQQKIDEGNGKPITELVAMLHAAIQAKQHYPESALQMERTGSATLAFLLFPDGTISHLRIAKASGTVVLDEAALAAVTQAVPFRNVSKYLTKPQEYQITVAFELT